MAINYTDNIIERLIKIIEGEFKKSLKIFKYDAFNKHIKQVSIVEMPIINEHTWSPGHVVDRIFINLILRHQYQEDANKKEFINKDFHRLHTAILANRSDTTTKWFNGLIVETEQLEIETDDEEKPKFYKRVCHFSCLIAYEHQE